MKIFAKVGKERIEIYPVTSADFKNLGAQLVRGIPSFYDVDNPSKVWPEPADYVSIIREE